MRPPLLALFLATTLLAAPSLGVSASEAPTIRYPAAADFLVVELYPGGPRSPEGDTAFTRIYGDGRVRVHRPSVYREAGDFQAWLTLADLDSLLRDFAGEGILDFDLRAVKEQRLAAELERLREKGSVPGIADAATVTLTIRLAQYAPSGATEVTPNYWKSISWYALDEDALSYPEVAPLVRLERAVARLKHLTESAMAAARSGDTIVALPALQAE